MELGTITAAQIRQLGAAIADYLKPQRGTVANHQPWDMHPQALKDAIANGWLPPGCAGKTVADTIALRHAVSRAAHAAAGNVPVLNGYAVWVIKTWGRLKTHTASIHEDAALFHVTALATSLGPEHLRAATKVANQFPFLRVSSWSKWLSFQWPDRALVYDSRVAFGINAINVIEAAGAPAFPTPTGRSPLMQILSAEHLAVFQSIGIGDSLDELEADEIKEVFRQHVVGHGEFYERYLEVMRVAHDLLWPAPTEFERTEMLLFSQTRAIFADLAKRVMNGTVLPGPSPITVRPQPQASCTQPACPLTGGGGAVPVHP